MPRFRGFTGRRSSGTSVPPPTKEDIINTLDQFGDRDSRENVMSLSYPPPKNQPQHLYHHHQYSRGNKSGNSGSQSDEGLTNNDHPPKRAPSNTEDLESTSMATAYCAEWERLFMEDDYLRKLKEFGMGGRLRSSRFRSICWKVYLECLPENRREWVAKTRAWRNKYDDLKTKLIINPRKAMDKADLSVNNPLSQEEESPWNQFFQDNELRLTIKQDVIRTFPEIAFFQSDTVQETMLDILFCYARINKKLMYKQGMHELLAPLIFVLHCDHQAFLHACEIETIEAVVREMLNPEYIEHDAFTMFCQIMETVEPWYVSKEISPTVKNSNIFTAQPFARHQDMHPSNVIITKLTRIQDYVLKRFDPELHSHLERMEIAPQIYGIRWVRLLFGREFPMQDLLVLWDAIFADGISFDLVDYIFVGMLQYIRELLLSSDYPTCLTTLMKFPPVGDVHYFVDKALYLREPNEQPKPHDYVYQKSPQGGSMSQSQLLDRVTKSYSRSGGAVTASVMSSLTSLTRKLNQTRPRTLGLESSPKKISKSTSEPMNLLTDESPEYPPIHEKRGSTASLSKLETGMMGITTLRPTISSQSLARLETTSVRLTRTISTPSFSRSHSVTPQERLTVPPSGGVDRLTDFQKAQLRVALRSALGLTAADLHHTLTTQRRTTSSLVPSRGRNVRHSVAVKRQSAGSVANIDQLSPEERYSPPSGHKFSTLPTRGKKGKKRQQERSAEYDLAIMMGRLHDMEAMCRHCSHKMDKHIDKLQVEMMRQSMHNEDELLLAIAGLKQVRDVLKGILKPSNIFEEDEIRIRDNHYRDELSSTDMTPSSVTSRGDRSSPEMRRAAHAAIYNANNADTSSSPDSSSPEYSENVRPKEVSQRPQTKEVADSTPLVIARETKPEIEMISLKMEVSNLSKQFSNSSENGGIVMGYHGEGSGPGHRRSYSEGNHEFDLFDPNQNKAGRGAPHGTVPDEDYDVDY